MKNLRGSVLTLLAAIMVASGASQATAQLPPPNLAGAMPLPSQPMPPGGMAGPLSGPTGPQGLIMPPPQAMQHFAGQGMMNQTPMAVAQLPPGPGAYGPQSGFGAPAGYGPAAYGPSAYGPAAYGPSMMQPNYGVQQASYGVPQPFPQMGGNVVPAGHTAGCAGCGGHGCASCMGGGGCASCGGAGCGACLGGGSARGFLDRAVDWLLPYAEGGQCAPRLYDITLDAMYLRREEAGRAIGLSTDDGTNGLPNFGTGDLDFGHELGFKFTGARQIFAGATAEFTYYGLFNWSDSATLLRDPANFDPVPPPPGTPPFADDIFSVFSNFGLINAPDGFDETDRARQHSISASSSFDNFELNFRKRFTAPNCRLQYSWLAGIRYFYLLEDFELLTIGGGTPSRGMLDYDVQTRNSLTGFQIGGDAWFNVVPGINIGADLKTGIYGNYANQTTTAVASTTNPALANTFRESIDANDVALVADANFYFLWRLGPHWTFRAGYSFLVAEGVALATENINVTGPPPVLAGAAATRVPGINDNGHAFYHGGFLGAEWVW